MGGVRCHERSAWRDCGSRTGREGDGLVLRGAERRVRSGALPPRIGSWWGSGAAWLSGVNDPFEAAF